MSLKVYNSLTQKKEEFVPIKKGKVGLYACGITAYDACHLGHARAAVAFDIVYRFLKSKGLKVTYVRNFTDIDDKIIKRSQETKIPWNELTKRYMKGYGDDMALLHCERPTKEPRATEHIPEMIQSIEAIIQNGKAYVSQGNVYYAVREFKDYGKLSHKNIEDLESGARIEIDETKKDPLDFALWKNAKPGEPKWQSPWGEGRPGWHIECSAMSTKYLGQPFDIHGGGRDLIFPHHENEIAQAEGASNKKFCNYFLHNGFININAEKMSKSLGNFRTIKEVCAKHDAEVVRFFLIAAHYGSPLDYTEKNMAEAKVLLDRYYLLTSRLVKIPFTKGPKPPSKMTEIEKELRVSLEDLPQKFDAAMEDDFNTPKALGVFFETVRLWNKYLDQADNASPFAIWAKGNWNQSLGLIQKILGVFDSDPAAYFDRLNAIKATSAAVDIGWVEKKIEERRIARAQKDYKRGDQIREELLKRGITIKDCPDGSTDWRFQ